MEVMDDPILESNVYFVSFIKPRAYGVLLACGMQCSDIIQLEILSAFFFTTPSHPYLCFDLPFLSAHRFLFDHHFLFDYLAYCLAFHQL